MAVFLEEFGQVIASGGAGIVISSMAGYMPPPRFSSVRSPMATSLISPDKTSQGRGPAFFTDPKGLERQVAGFPAAA